MIPTHGGYGMKSLPFYPLLVVLLVGLGGYLGCDPGTAGPAINPATGSPALQVQLSSSIPNRTAETIIVGSFNMQRLGPSKMNDPSVMNAYAAIIRQFDVIALQEITDKSGNALRYLLQLVNQSGARYSVALSDPVGRPSSGYFEQYAFLYDTTRVTHEFGYLVEDSRDWMHREPWVGRFKTQAAAPFVFTLINVHTDPDEIARELDVMADVTQSVRAFEYNSAGIDDVIVLGDLNAAPGKLRNLERIQGISTIINLPTNTPKNKTLDNLLLDRTLTSEFTGRAGTLDLQTAFQLSLDDAKKISDHLPIWAEFYSQRSGATAMTATRPASGGLR